MISISKSYSFDSAHQLIRDDWEESANRTVFGKCYRKHGHTYGLVVEITGHIDENDGMILNYFELDKIMKPLVAKLDHRNLNEVFPNMLTTSENMVGAIAHQIEAALREEGIGFFVDRGGNEQGVSLYRVTLSETPKTTATWQA